MGPLVSLFIPTRRRPELLTRALKSAFAQNYPHLEILVVIDGPDPATAWALRPYLGHPQLRVIQRPTQGGACRARNDAIESAQGELITGLDDDDELLVDHVTMLVQALQRSKAPFVATTSVLLRQTGTLVRHAFEGPVLLDRLLSENVIGNQVLTYTAHLRAVGGFDPNMPAWQDYDLWVRLTERFGPGYKIDARTYLQHQEHDLERISSRNRIFLAHETFARKHSSLLSEKHLASLELLAFATAHEPISFAQLIRFVRAGTPRRAATAFVADHFPRLRTFLLRTVSTKGHTRR